jgi:hypothetical protein
MSDAETWFVIGGLTGLALGTLITAHLFWATEVSRDE